LLTFLKRKCWYSQVSINRYRQTVSFLACSLVDLFTQPFPSPEVEKVKTILTEYNNLLLTAKLTNQTLSDLPVPTDLDPSKPIPLPSRFSTLILLIRDTISVLVRVPFFFMPMLIHLPMYYVAKLGENIVREELETQAQMKIVFGMLFSLLVYPVVFLVMWLMLGFTSVGAIVAAGGVYLFNMSHKTLVDENYDRLVCGPSQGWSAENRRANIHISQT
jgi:glycerol-3-phosphate O-acyltransferase/dihydroxyacetone phosphate acyltransferase